jgi:ABC-type sugar transport system permease subunit
MDGTLTLAGVARRTRIRAGRIPWPLPYILPSLAALALVFGYPLVTVIRDSLYSGDPQSLVYVGLDNYRAALSDPVFVQSMLNNLKMLLAVPVMTIIALLAALALNDRIRGWRVYRSVLFLPYVLPAAALGITFSYLLQRNGVLNTILHDMGASRVALDWLGSSHTVMLSVGGVVIWQQMGLGIIIFTAALLVVPQEMVEAALTDGATWLQVQRHILIPQIRRSILFFLVLEGIYVLSSLFSTVYVLTRGGPGNSSSVLELYIWNNGFVNGSVGVASAAAVLLLGIAALFIVVFARLWTRAVAL